MGETVRHTKRGGSSSLAGRQGGVAGRTNYAEEVVDRNVKEAADFAAHFFAENNVRRVVIFGTEENVSSFRSQLPKVWQSLIVGTFSMSMTANKDDVKEHAMQIGREAERQREVTLVKSMITGAAKGRKAVTHLEDTLKAVHDGRVQTLVFRDGFRAPGYRCKGCGYLTSEKLDQCPFCGKTFENIPDAVELAVGNVMRLGGDVEVIHDSEKLTDFGNIGAVLRY
jgi:rubrerythrin